MKKRVLAWALALCLAVSLLPATALAAEGGTNETPANTIYVDATSGTANGTGTSTDPVKTIDQAMTLANASDVITVSNATSVQRGTVTKAITIQGAAGTEDVEVAIASGINGTVKFTNLTFDSTVLGNYDSSGYEGLDLVYDNCTFNNAAGNCVYITAPINSLTVTGCTFNGTEGSYAGQYLIWPYAAKNITITGNTFNSTVTRGAIHLGNGHSEGTAATIEGNTFKGFERVVQLALNNSAANSVTIQNNTLSDIGQRAGSSKAAYEYGLVFVHESYVTGETTVTIGENTYGEKCGEHIVYSENDADTTALGITFTGTIPEGMTQFDVKPAKIGSTYYTTLQAAIDAAGSGDTVTLLDDITVSGETFTVAKGQNITLDLAGHTIAGTDANATGNFYLILNNGNLTIKDSVGNGAITLTATTDRGWNSSSDAVGNALGTLTIESGTIKHLGGTTMAYAIDSLSNTGTENAVLTVNGGTLSSTYIAIRQFANSTVGSSIATINGGTITGKYGIWIQSPNSNANMSQLTVNNGTVDKILVYSTSKTTVALTGGTISDFSVSVTEGALADANISITGGTFAADPTTYVPTGYCVKTVTGDTATYTVAEHALTDAAAKAATCVDTGNTAYWYCANCGTCYSDAEGNTKTTLDAVTTAIDTSNHANVVTDAAVPATCTSTGLTEGSHCAACGIVVKAQEVTSAIAHTETTIPAVPATCTATGLTAGTKCSVCTEVLTAQEVVAMLDHTVVIDEAVAPTYTSTGLTEGSHCSVCNEILVAQVVLPMREFIYIPVTPSTPTEPETSTETTTNPDGSTTTTVTDKTTGTVTETTENVDGSTTTVETQKDGTVTETTENTDGSTVTVETLTDGTVTETVESTDGSVSVVETKADGTVTTTETDVVGVTVEVVAAPEEAPAITVTIPAIVEQATVTLPVEELTATTVAVNAETGEIVKTSVLTEDGLKVTLDESVELILVDNAKEFSDTADSWAQEGIAFTTSRELFNGTDTEAMTFDPTGTMSRAMLMTVLARLDGVDTSTGATWDEVGVAWAVENGISDGTAGSRAVDRQEMITMLYRYVGEPEVDAAMLAEMAEWGDWADVDPWCQQAMAWAVSTGLVNGINDTLSPEVTSDRAMVATLLMRFIESL